MPFFKIDNRLVYYAHVPKCGGSSIANYIHERFGALAFHDNNYMKQSATHRWTKSSPQHVDAVTLERLIPLSFFDAVFAIVRHPVKRAISTYHFQLEVERSLPKSIGFTSWLRDLQSKNIENAFAFDNHTRPMSDIVPEGTTVFHMEHGLDSLVAWFDVLTGNEKGPRAILPENTRGQHVKIKTERVTPSRTDLNLIAEIYATDFKRFGYAPESQAPKADAPVLNAAFLAARDRALAAAARPTARLRRKVMRKIWRL